MYGGTRASITTGFLRYGLSPRVRGNPETEGLGSIALRSIPACTGEPLPRDSPVDHGPVYPRVYGGTQSLHQLTISMSGLSPRVRGNRSHQCRLRPIERSIPACTGEPRAGERGRALAEVYPRVYGGTSDGCRSTCPPAGLSPRVRGNRADGSARYAQHRSIPACTGEPRSWTSMKRQTRVYPRVYGGTALSWRSPSFGSGLSPRVRGNPPGVGSMVDGDGSIPACTGEPLSQGTADIP